MTWMRLMLVVVLAWIGPLAAFAAEPRPNVIIVLTDDQGYGDLSCHGHPFLKTPNLDRLHSQSIRLTDFHVAPMCTPTRGQLMTGVSALANGAMNVSSGRTMLRRELPTMADHFAAAGYATGIFGKWHLGDNHPFRPQDRGFHKAIWFPSSHIPSAPDVWNNDYFDPHLRSEKGTLEQFPGYCTDVYFSESMKWMRSQWERKKPFLAYVPLNAAHGPLFIHEHYRALFPNSPRAQASFMGMIVNIDENMGRLEQFLVSTGMRENTIVIFMTDNGGTAGVPIWNAGMRGKKIELYEGGHRVPCFVRWPGGKIGGAAGSGKDVDELTQAQDILPTLMDLCGVSPVKPVKMDGLSLAGLLQGRAGVLPERMILTQFSRMNAPIPQKDDAAVMWRKWRLVGGKELYDLRKDFGQQRNVIGENPEVARKMQAFYDQWWSEISPKVNELQAITIGSDAENPLMLSPADWADSFLDQGAQIRAGLERNGAWHVNVERAGKYRIELRRWAREADLALNAPSPSAKLTDTTYPQGKALPIAKARLKIGDSQQAGPAISGSKQVSFEVDLKPGRTTLQTWLDDADGKPICGAYYVYVERMD